MAEREYERDEAGKFAETGTGSAEAKDLKRGKQAVTKAMGERLRGKQIVQLHRLREAKLKKIEDVPGELPPGKTKEEHEKIAKEVIEKHKKGFDAEIDALKKLAPEGAEVKGRVKDLTSALGKLKLKGGSYSDASKLGDVTGMRVVTDSVADAQKMVDDVRREYGDRVVEFDDKFNKPQGDYRSFHLTVLTKAGLKAELQIRTKNQNEHADWAHNVYKPLNEAQAALRNDPAVKEYSKKMADYFWEKDNGRDPGPKPVASEEIELVYGVPGRPRGGKRKVGNVTLPAF